MRVLNLFDIGSFVHAGAVNKSSFIDCLPIENADGYRAVTLQTGGLAQILNTLHDIDPNETCVFCADRRPTIKQGMYSEYKAQRKHDPNILKQKDIIEIVLADIGYTVLYEEGYEADDFIYSCVQKFKDDYDFIHVWTADSDLYFLVCDNVDICPSHSKAKKVTRENYEHTVMKGYIVPYNTLTYNKILGGDKSDNIPALSAAGIEALKPITSNSALSSKLADKNVLDCIAASAGEEVRKQIDLVYPLLVTTPDEFINRADRTRLRIWGGIIRAKKFRRVDEAPADYNAVIDEMIAQQLYED